MLQSSVMSVAVRQPMSVAEFLAWEERQELRWEFDGFQPVAMTGGQRRMRQLGETSAIRANPPEGAGVPGRSAPP